MHIPAATLVCHNHLFRSLFLADIDGSLLSSSVVTDPHAHNETVLNGEQTYIYHK